MLDRLKPREGSRKKPIRVGRGPGSGRHKTCGRGVKGQGKRSPGRETPAWFEGGQMPLVRRLPKRGFHNPFRKPVQIVNLRSLSVFGEGTTVDVEALCSRGLARRGVPVKLLGDGEAPKNLNVKVQRVSQGARARLEQAGGSVEIVA
jgi:large subunit ribosomal protein L15